MTVVSLAAERLRRGRPAPPPCAAHWDWSGTGRWCLSKTCPNPQPGRPTRCPRWEDDAFCAPGKP